MILTLMLIEVLLCFSFIQLFLDKNKKVLTNSFWFKTLITFSFLIGSIAIGLLVSNGIFLIAKIFNYFAIAFTEEIANKIAKILFIVVISSFITTLIALIFGPLQIKK